MTFGSLGAIAIAPIEATFCLSKIGLKVSPPFVVLMIPPLAPATKYVEGLPGMPTTTEMRPALFAGPTDRHGSRPSVASSRDEGRALGRALARRE